MYYETHNCITLHYIKAVLIGIKRCNLTAILYYMFEAVLIIIKLYSIICNRVHPWYLMGFVLLDL